MTPPRRIAIVGAGIIGVSTAAWLRDRLPSDAEISIFGKELSPNTTGESAAGLWLPYCLSETPEYLLWSRLKRTWDFLTSFLSGTDHPNMGICYQPLFVFHESPSIEKPFWADIVATFNMLEPAQVQRLVSSARSGFLCTTVTAEGEKIVQFFYRRLLAQGVRFFKRKIINFEELADEDYDLIINCSGLGSKELVPDEDVYPIRGQIQMINAPWIRAAMFMGTSYIIPNMDKVILGGTSQQGDWCEEGRMEDKKKIIEDCTKLMPACSKAKIIGEWTGLRPGRKIIRLEHEVRVRADGRRYDIVHNYGHGGSGLALFWGCAEDAGKLALDLLRSAKL